MEWQPSFLSRLFRRAASWRLKIENDQFSVTLNEQTYPIPLEAFSSLRFRDGLLWTNVTVWVGNEIHLVGLRKSARHTLSNQLRAVTSRQNFRTYYAKIMGWLKLVDQVALTVDAEHRWLTHDMQHELLSEKDALKIDDADLKALFDSPVIQTALGDNKTRVLGRLRQWSQDWPTHWQTRNKAHMIRELDACSDLLDSAKPSYVAYSR